MACAAKCRMHALPLACMPLPVLVLLVDQAVRSSIGLHVWLNKGVLETLMGLPFLLLQALPLASLSWSQAHLC